MYKRKSLWLFFVFHTIRAQYDVGDVCEFDERRSGVCDIIHNCEYAKKRIYEDQVHVPGCSWDGKTRIVCCPEGDLTHETGVLRDFFLDSDDGVIRNSDVVCRYNGELPMSCCPRTPYYSPPPEPKGCPPLPRIKMPSFTDPTHKVAWEKCVANQRYVHFCETDDRALTGFSRTYACNVIDDDQRISSDTPAEPKEFPHMAVLGCKNKKEIDDAGDAAADILWVGGGSLISDRYILTAAHVTSTTIYGRLRYALLGTLDKTDIRSGELYYIVQIMSHKGYVSTEKHDDIALLELDRQVRLSEFIRPICLPIPGILHDETNRVIAGWGENGSTRTASKILIKGYIQEVEPSACIKSLRANNFTWDDRIMICARGLRPVRGQYPDSCQGDSGGPLMSRVTNDDLVCNYIINGVISWGPNCGTGQPAAYTRVAPYVSWIVKTVWPEQITKVQSNQIAHTSLRFGR